ncbi:hypothetical protein O181_088131 [Austropuccinia psidii MF-1]|uniref:Uncharacterized protein n=1 Tax=Austropuccinia psidii MF-1 TaxID=1389203 RepID=A0A9Q3IR06_9BASI|nr:hypothetical protein [Austropuccinia psidii MF-1]
MSSMSFKYNDSTNLTLEFSINDDGNICRCTALSDTGTSGAFMNKSFVDKRSLICSLRSSPLTVQSYNGQQLDSIQHIWLGSLTLKAIDNTPYTLALQANVTKLAKIDIILGIPWIQAANAWIGGRSLSMMIGNLAFVNTIIKRSDMPIDNSHSLDTSVVHADSTPQQALPPVEKLPLFLNRFKSVFSSFSNSCFPPLHHGFDCSIKLKPNSVLPLAVSTS